MASHERIRFRLFNMPCCGHLLCWVNPRLPSFCPECGAPAVGAIRRDPSCIIVTDDNAELTVHAKLPNSL